MRSLLPLSLTVSLAAASPAGLPRFRLPNNLSPRFANVTSSQKSYSSSTSCSTTTTVMIVSSSSSSTSCSTTPVVSTDSSFSPISSSRVTTSATVIAIVPAVPNDPFLPDSFNSTALSNSLHFTPSTASIVGSLITAQSSIVAASTVSEGGRLVPLTTPSINFVQTALPSTVLLASEKVPGPDVTVATPANAVTVSNTLAATAESSKSSASLTTTKPVDTFSLVASSSKPSTSMTGMIAIVPAIPNDPNYPDASDSLAMTKSLTFMPVTAPSSVTTASFSASSEDPGFDETVTLSLTITTTMFSTRASPAKATLISDTRTSVPSPGVTENSVSTKFVSFSIPAISSTQSANQSPSSSVSSQVTQGDTFPLIQQSAGSKVSASVSSIPLPASVTLSSSSTSVVTSSADDDITVYITSTSTQISTLTTSQAPTMLTLGLPSISTVVPSSFLSTIAVSVSSTQTMSLADPLLSIIPVASEDGDGGSSPVTIFVTTTVALQTVTQTVYTASPLPT